MAKRQNSVSYSPDLIKILREEHRSIFSLLAQIKELLSQNNFSAAEPVLNQFKSAAFNHVIKENLKLYVYLQHIFQNQPQEYARLREIRKNVDYSEAMMVDFVEKYQDFHQDAQKQDTILQDFEKLYTQLSRKKKIEEKDVFPMYRPPDA